MPHSSNPTSVSPTKRSQKRTENSQREQMKLCENGRTESEDLRLDQQREATQSASERELSSNEQNDDSLNTVGLYF